MITAEELKSVIYEYQMTEITEADDDIGNDAIQSAVSEVRGYFIAANNRRETANLTKQQYRAWVMYDVDALFSATIETTTTTDEDSGETTTETTDYRNPFVCRLIKRVAVWNLVELSAPDVILDKVKERYEATIQTLEKIAGMGDYAQNRLIVYDAPMLVPTDDEEEELSAPMRMVSRQKFTHEF